MQHWISHWLGLDNAAGPIYLFFSGSGSNLSQVTIIGTLIAAYRHHMCHVDHPKSCRRLALHPVVGTPYRACRRHHPAVPDRVTAEHIADAHRGDS